jgi:uncharacterized protein (TIGR02145 family)
MRTTPLFPSAAALLAALALTLSCSGGDEEEVKVGRGNDMSNYATVVIGEQTWMAENLDYAVEGGMCYNNDSLNCERYGRLYDCETAKTVCPRGWRLPTAEDWDVLMDFVQTDNGYSYDGLASKAGLYLKAVDGWDSYNSTVQNKWISGNGLDKYGFAALPGGCGYDDGSFYYIGEEGYWWNASDECGDEDWDGGNWNLIGGYDSSVLFPARFGIDAYYSVRCVKD